MKPLTNGLITPVTTMAMIDQAVTVGKNAKAATNKPACTIQASITYAISPPLSNQRRTRQQREDD